MRRRRSGLRPILMTTAAMALGVVPLIYRQPAPARPRAISMGLVIFTGHVVGTIFTLFVVPMFYTFISRPAKIVERAKEEPLAQPRAWAAE